MSEFETSEGQWVGWAGRYQRIKELDWVRMVEQKIVRWEGPYLTQKVYRTRAKKEVQRQQTEFKYYQ